MEKIVPTVWLRNELDFYKLVRLFYTYGIKELRVNCTRHNINNYISEIKQFNTWSKKKLNYTFKIILDVPIPNKKIRIFYKSDGNGKYINKDEILNILFKPIDEMISGNYLYIPDYTLLSSLNIKDCLYIGETGLKLKVLDIKENMIISKCISGGELGYGKYVLTDKIKFQSCHIDEIMPYIKMCNIVNPEMIALSFINNRNDILNIINRDEWMCDAKIIAKIETEEGYHNLKDILRACKIPMVARGDLLNNVKVEKFAKYVTDIVEYCEAKKTHYYVATGFLSSFNSTKTPISRAELIDIYTILKKKYSKIILTYDVCKNLNVAERVLSLIRNTVI